MRGRKPLPPELHRSRGTYQKSRHESRDMQAPGELLKDPPTDLTPEQQELWRAAIEQAPWLRAADAGLLTLWVEVTDRNQKARIAQAEMDRDSKLPLLQQDPRTGEIRPSPYLRVLDRTAELIIRLGSELGFSPASRARLQTSSKPPPDSSDDPEGPWAKLRLLQGGRAGEGGEAPT